tara:strand:- start:2669 stop:3463 length:795 start_codon:yes stop_codon:yes gene_type:complete
MAKAYLDQGEMTKRFMEKVRELPFKGMYMLPPIIGDDPEQNERDARKSQLRQARSIRAREKKAVAWTPEEAAARKVRAKSKRYLANVERRAVAHEAWAKKKEQLRQEGKLLVSKKTSAKRVTKAMPKRRVSCGCLTYLLDAFRAGGRVFEALHNEPTTTWESDNAIRKFSEVIDHASQFCNQDFDSLPAGRDFGTLGNAKQEMRSGTPHIAMTAHYAVEEALRDAIFDGKIPGLRCDTRHRFKPKEEWTREERIAHQKMSKYIL